MDNRHKLSAKDIAYFKAQLKTVTDELDGELKKLRLSKLRIGRLLIRAKRILPHGDWMKYVGLRGLNVRAAQRYIKLAKCDKLSHLKDDHDVTYKAAGLLSDLTEPDGIDFPKAVLKGRSVGCLWPVTFYFPTEQEAQAMKYFFRAPKTVRPDVEKLRACVAAYKQTNHTQAAAG